MEKIIYPEAKQIILSHDGIIKAGKYTIGIWSKDYVGGGFHFRPSPNEGRAIYMANLNNNSVVQTFYKSELRLKIVEACKRGVTGEYNE
jgi:hypothetical protein